MYLWPFSNQQLDGYVDKFVKFQKQSFINNNNKNVIPWAVEQYNEALQQFQSQSIFL